MSIFDKTTALAKDLFLEALPHNGRGEEELRAARRKHSYSVLAPTEELAAKVVDGPDDVEVGDLLIYWDLRPSENKYSAYKYLHPWMTARELAAQGGGYGVAIVTAKSPKSFAVKELLRPGYAWFVDLNTLHAVRELNWATPEVVRWKGTTNRREVGNLGSFLVLLSRMQADSRWGEWADLLEASRVEQERLKDSEAKVRKEEDERLKPQREAMARVNKVLGSDVVSMGWLHRDAPTVKGWLAQGDNLRVHLAGLLWLNRLPEPQYFELLGDLRTLGF